MNKDFDSMEGLIDEVRADRSARGAGASQLNRYPVRFVIFDNFGEAKTFVDKLIDMGVTRMQKIVDWLEPSRPDQMLSHSALADLIRRYVKANSSESCIIVPFSELARFYDNETAREFSALIGDIKGIETTPTGFAQGQRIYIPLIGQYGKMAPFFDDSQSVIWHLEGQGPEGGYRLTLSASDYGVRGLRERFVIARNLKEWLEVWRDDVWCDDAWRDRQRPGEILCTSRALTALARNAQPDNALSYTICHNAHEFLTQGLHLDLGDLAYQDSDEGYWERLAREIDCTDFSLREFFNRYFGIYDLSDCRVFAKTWFDHPEHFERWLLTLYYIKRFRGEGYVSRVLRRCKHYTDAELLTGAALDVFDQEDPEACLAERKALLDPARRRGLRLSEEAEELMHRKLTALVEAQGYETALRYMTGLSRSEKLLLIEWVAGRHVAPGRLRELFPGLCDYLGPTALLSGGRLEWINGYIDAYKRAKVANAYTPEVEEAIARHNADAVTFDSWYQQLKTVRTELSDHTDIDVFYWIDGLGIDWVPFIIRLAERNSCTGFHVDEVRTARALLPTTTARNKAELEKLTGGNLAKKGDLDGFAHRCTPYPRYILDEMEIVEQAVCEIMAEHAGQRVAIVSDHGLSYLSQLLPGLSLAGIAADHCGRCAEETEGTLTSDSHYIRLDDGRTVCALRHESLGAKIPSGQGCHGGCTPEEVVVPIIILSSQRQRGARKIDLVNKEVSAADPVLTLIIPGTTRADMPRLIYDNTIYALHPAGADRYVSDRLALRAGVNEAEVCIGSQTQRVKFTINLGAEEDDLFGDL